MHNKQILKAVIFVLAFLYPMAASAQPHQAVDEKATKDYIFQTGLDILPGENTTSLRFQFASRYPLRSNLSAGLGIGFSYYHDPLSLLPLFVDFKYNIQEAGVVPFLFFKSGYNFSILTDTETLVDSHEGGVMLNPGIGVQFKAESKTSWFLDVGYSIDRASFQREMFGDRVVKTNISYKRLMFGAGLSF